MATGWYPDAKAFPTSKKYTGNPGLWAVVCHIADGAYAGSRDWLQNAASNPNSSSHFIIDDVTGEVSQLVSIFDRSWANGLAWDKVRRVYIDPEKHIVSPPWHRLAPGGIDPNLYTISIEHAGTHTAPRPAIQIQSTIKLLRWIAQQTGLVYRRGDTLIGHSDISPISRANCPGPLFPWNDIMTALAETASGVGLPTPLPYVGAPQSISAATFKAVLIDHQSPLAPWADVLYRWCVDVDIDACVALAHSHAESDFGKDEPARSLANPFNLKEHFGFDANADGFSDFSGGANGGGGAWLGWRWALDWLKRYGCQELRTVEQIAPKFVTGSASADVSGYIQKIRQTVAEIRKREA